MNGTIAALARSATHGFSKQQYTALDLVAGVGIAGDAHAGVTVQHLSRQRATPDAPNLRQVHLLDTGLVARLAALGFAIQPGDIGENIVIDGLALSDLPTDTLLSIGSDGVEIALTGLRNPCRQLDDWTPGLMSACLERTPEGPVRRMGGVMAIVVAGGRIAVGDACTVRLPDGPLRPLEPV